MPLFLLARAGCAICRVNLVLKRGLFVLYSTKTIIFCDPPTSPGGNLVPRGPFCHALEISGPLARPNDIPVLNGCVNTID